MVSVASEQAKFVELSQEHRDLRFRAAMRATQVGLGTPVFRLEGGLPFTAGVPLSVAGILDRNGVALECAPGRVARFELTRWDGWMVLWPWDIRLASITAWRIGWVVFLLTPLGWWAWLALGQALPACPERVKGGGEMR